MARAAAASTARSDCPWTRRRLTSGRSSSPPAARATALSFPNCSPGSRRTSRSAPGGPCRDPGARENRGSGIPSNGGSHALAPIRRNGRFRKESCPAALARNDILRATRRLGRALRRTFAAPMAPRFRLTLETMVRLPCPQRDRGEDEGAQVPRRTDCLGRPRPPDSRNPHPLRSRLRSDRWRLPLLHEALRRPRHRRNRTRGLTAAGERGVTSLRRLLRQCRLHPPRSRARSRSRPFPLSILPSARLARPAPDSVKAARSPRKAACSIPPGSTRHFDGRADRRALPAVPYPSRATPPRGSAQGFGSASRPTSAACLPARSSAAGRASAPACRAPKKCPIAKSGRTARIRLASRAPWSLGGRSAAATAHSASPPTWRAWPCRQVGSLETSGSTAFATLIAL